jgi:hypothetical protein
MRTPEDPCRDPASEARDDHASEPSEPRATPETDALVPSQGRIRTMREYIDELEAHARRLERQRDELLEALERFARLPGDYNLIMDYGWAIRDSKQTIARVKGGRDE